MSIPAPTAVSRSCDWRRNFRPGLRLSLAAGGNPGARAGSGSRPGGVIATKEKDGFRFELGPQSFLSTEPLLKLIDALGLKDQLLHANPRAPRYILVGGRLVPAPLAPPSLLTTPLFSARHEMAASHRNAAPHAAARGR